MLYSGILYQNVKNSFEKACICASAYKSVWLQNPCEWCYFQERVGAIVKRQIVYVNRSIENIPVTSTSNKNNLLVFKFLKLYLKLLLPIRKMLKYVHSKVFHHK